MRFVRFRQTDEIEHHQTLINVSFDKLRFCQIHETLHNKRFGDDDSVLVLKLALKRNENI